MFWADHLLSDPATPRRVTVIESHHMLGCGVAYSTSDPGHLLNMRIASLSVFRNHFSSLAGRAVHAVRDTSFVRHATDSADMTNLLAPLSTDGRLDTTWTGAAQLDDGSIIPAARAALTIGHTLSCPNPGPQSLVKGAAPGARRARGDHRAWPVDGRPAISPLSRGNRGEIKALSRRAQLPRKPPCSARWTAARCAC